MFVLKIVTTLFNLNFLWTIIFFSWGLSWDNQEQRPSIVVFSAMVITFALNTCLIWLNG